MKILISSLLGVVVLLASASVNTVRLQESGSAKVGSAAPSFGGWDLAGRRVLTLDGLRRTPSMAPLLITFGASWCTACAAGLPRLKALSQKHPEMRLVLIDVESDGQKAQEFAAKMGIDGPAILDKFEQIARTYGVSDAKGAGGKKPPSLPPPSLLHPRGRTHPCHLADTANLEL